MKFLVAIAAFVAVAAAYPHEEIRAKRSAILGVPVAAGAVVQGPQAVLAGPSGTVTADAGSISAGPTAAAALVAPAVSSAGAVIAPGATIVGPSSAALIPAGGVLAAPGILGANGWWGNGLVAAAPGVILGSYNRNKGE